MSNATAVENFGDATLVDWDTADAESKVVRVTKIRKEMESLRVWRILIFIPPR
jgi:hypothetical protein